MSSSHDQDFSVYHQKGVTLSLFTGCLSQLVLNQPMIGMMTPMVMITMMMMMMMIRMMMMVAMEVGSCSVDDR